MDATVARCTVCSTDFEVRFRYQVKEDDAQGFVRFCSHGCLGRWLEDRAHQDCSVCGRRFALEFPFQVADGDRAPVYFCSTPCRNAGLGGLRAPTPLGSADPASPAVAKSPAPSRCVRRIAVFNHKGGTGKTTTAVNLAAGLAEGGARVLLVDADGQGNVGASLGIRGEKTLYHVLVHRCSVAEAAVTVRPNLDVLCANELLAAAELHLAGQPNRHRVLRERLAEGASGYDVVVLDCAPALSLMNQNALVYAEGVIVPVSCDYLSLVGVKQVLRTVRQVRELLRHDVELLGVLPTFYDVRNRSGREAVEVLTGHFGERCLPPIRINTKLREAPTVKQTIFELAPESRGAADYLALVRRVEALWAGRAVEARAATGTPPRSPETEVDIDVEIDVDVDGVDEGHDGSSVPRPVAAVPAE
ncbi:MAG TPA: ParA family protein [Polyangiaceae bacterium LLY-WYZ-14_1]|nr:ParA family protein [Polyangiaceae bacterium LLY-WYZ-14_1]